jgi:hypothetical protein
MAVRVKRSEVAHLLTPELAKPLAREPKGREPNGTERRFVAEIYEPMRLAGEARRCDYEPEKFRLADRTYFTPDYRVWMADREIRFYEVKGGFVRDDAMVKLKVFAELHPMYAVYLAAYARRSWSIRRIPSGS